MMRIWCLRILQFSILNVLFFTKSCRTCKSRVNLSILIFFYYWYAIICWSYICCRANKLFEMLLNYIFLPKFMLSCIWTQYCQTSKTAEHPGKSHANGGVLSYWKPCQLTTSLDPVAHCSCLHVRSRAFHLLPSLFLQNPKTYEADMAFSYLWPWHCQQQ